MRSIQIFILARDRPSYLVASLNSAIAQEINEFNLQVIVSDNSESDDVEDIMKRSYGGVKYIRRVPSLKVWDHFRLVISEASADYVVFFHDDDILLPDYCQAIINEFKANPEASAIGCNAIKFNNSGAELGRFHTHRHVKIINDEAWLLNQYIPSDAKEKGIAPFPSYCYRLSSLRVEDIDEKDGGACADATFIAKKIKYGPIVWLPETLMKYRLHYQSGSSGIHIDDYIGLWRYMVSIGLDKHGKNFADWRRSLWFSWYVREKTSKTRSRLVIPCSWRDVVIQKAFLRQHIKHPNRIYLKMLGGFLWHKIHVRLL